MSTEIHWKEKLLHTFFEELEKEGISKNIQDILKQEGNAILKDLKVEESEVENFYKNLKVKHIQHLFTADELVKRGASSHHECIFLFRYLDKLDKEVKPCSTHFLKLYCDPIQGHIELHPACQMIVDTPQFQRLRFIKQLGLVYYVYPGAAHNRFEHSLGVCHLAGQFAQTLRENQPYLGITDKDILCIQISGLCQDLGRGPFSRLYTDYFVPAVRQKQVDSADIKPYRPTLEMFNHLIATNGLKDKLLTYGLDEKDLEFIQENISGTKTTGSTAWPLTGRNEHKAYLYEIVSNKRNGIDVYKWDYLARDCHHLGISNNFDSLRYMKFARVIEEDGEVQICMRDKEIGNLYSMFYTRYTLDKCAYKHRVSSGLELMISEALIKANDHVTFAGEKGLQKKLSDCINDMEAYTQLTDNVLFKILYTEDKDKGEPSTAERAEKKEDLNEAKKLIQRLLNRDLYKCVHESKPMSNENNEIDQDSETTLENKIIAAIEEQEPRDKCKECIIVKKVTFDFGMKDINPVERLKVYKKHQLYEAQHSFKNESSIIMSPEKFKEIRVRVYSRNRDANICDLLRNAAKSVLTKFEKP